MNGLAVLDITGLNKERPKTKDLSIFCRNTIVYLQIVIIARNDFTKNGGDMMKYIDRRKHPRVETSNLISHVSIDENGHCFSNGLGRALNISRSGVLLETAFPIEAKFVSLMTEDMDNNLIEIKGGLIYCKEVDSNMYHAGINFIGTADEIAEFATRLIKVYSYRKNNVVLAVA